MIKLKKGIVTSIYQEGQETWYGMYTGIENLWLDMNELKIKQVLDHQIDENQQYEADISHIYNRKQHIHDFINMCEGEENKAFSLDNVIFIVSKETKNIIERINIEAMQPHEITRILRNWRVIE